MHITDAFEGDNNAALKTLQRDLYPAQVGAMYSKLKRRYLIASEIVSVRDDIYYVLSDQKTFDCQFLQEAHDLIAAYYRFIHGAFDFPLREDDAEAMERLKKEWVNFFNAEVEEMADTPEIVKAFVIVASNAGNETGRLGESMLAYHLIGKYGPAFAKACKRFQKKPPCNGPA